MNENPHASADDAGTCGVTARHFAAFLFLFFFFFFSFTYNYEMIGTLLGD